MTPPESVTVAAQRLTLELRRVARECREDGALMARVSVPRLDAIADCLRDMQTALAEAQREREALREAERTDVDLGDVIAVGEPGCYVVEGHLSLEAAGQMLRLVTDEWDEDITELEFPRHTWMLSGDADGDTQGERWFREVLPGTEGAESFTLIACVDEWKGPTHERA